MKTTKVSIKESIQAAQWEEKHAYEQLAGNMQMLADAYLRCAKEINGYAKRIEEGTIEGADWAIHYASVNVNPRLDLVAKYAGELRMAKAQLKLLRKMQENGVEE